MARVTPKPQTAATCMSPTRALKSTATATDEVPRNTSRNVPRNSPKYAAVSCFITTQEYSHPFRRLVILSTLYTFPWATRTPSMARAGLRGRPYFSRTSSERTQSFTTSASIPDCVAAALAFSNSSLHFLQGGSRPMTSIRILDKPPSVLSCTLLPKTILHRDNDL